MFRYIKIKNIVVKLKNSINNIFKDGKVNTAPELNIINRKYQL